VGLNEFAQFARPAAYQYFKLEVTATVQHELRIGELKLFTLSPGSS